LASSAALRSPVINVSQRCPDDGDAHDDFAFLDQLGIKPILVAVFLLQNGKLGGHAFLLGFEVGDLPGVVGEIACDDQLLGVEVAGPALFLHRLHAVLALLSLDPRRGLGVPAALRDRSRRPASSPPVVHEVLMSSPSALFRVKFSTGSSKTAIRFESVSCFCLPEPSFPLSSKSGKPPSLLALARLKSLNARFKTGRLPPLDRGPAPENKLT
jgi:hypothetical protein